DDPGDDALVPVAARHLVADAELALAGDENFDLLDDARIDVVAAFDAIHRALTFQLQLRELVFVARDNLPDLVPDRARIDLDVIVNRGQLPQQRLRDLAIRRDNDLAGFGVHHIKRDFFAQQN